jgi:hypothetical protein
MPVLHDRLLTYHTIIITQAIDGSIKGLNNFHRLDVFINKAADHGILVRCLRMYIYIACTPMSHTLNTCTQRLHQPFIYSFSLKPTRHDNRLCWTCTGWTPTSRSRPCGMTTSTVSQLTAGFNTLLSFPRLLID